MYYTPSLESYETLQDKHTILKNPTIEQETGKKQDSVHKGESVNASFGFGSRTEKPSGLVKSSS